MNRSARGWLIATVLLCLLAPHHLRAAGTNEPPLGFGVDVPVSAKPVRARLLKPVTFDSLTERLDFVHANLQYSMQGYLEDVDTILVDESDKRLPIPPVLFRVTPYLVVKEDKGFEVSVEPDFDMQVQLPNLEHRFDVFLESAGRDDLPGLDPTEREAGSHIGLRSYSEKLHMHTDAGIRMRWPPELFVRGEWRQDWNVFHLVIQPRQRIFWESEDGLGSLTTVTLHHWMGRNRDVFIQSVSAGRYTTETTEGFEMEETIMLGWVKEALEAKWNWRRVLGVSDIARGYMLRYSIFGHADSDEMIIDRHRLTYTYRRPLYKHWIYLEVAPGVQTYEDDETESDVEPTDPTEWRLESILTIGVDMLFWGTYER